MKKIILFLTIILLTIQITSASSRWQIDKILNIKFWVEQIEYKLSELPAKNFKSKILQAKYNQMRIINKALTWYFYKAYTAWKIDYYTTKWIIINHKKFIYNTSKLFEYLELKLENPNYIDIDEKIINSYSQMRISYNRIRFLFNRSQKD